MNILPILMMLAYVSVLVYIVLLFGRLVRAVEHIARKIESSSRSISEQF